MRSPFMRFCGMFRTASCAICFGDRADVHVSARVPTTTLRKVPPHANTFAIVFANLSVIPLFQFGVLLDRRGFRWTRSFSLLGSHRVLLSARSGWQSNLHSLTTMSNLAHGVTQEPSMIPHSCSDRRPNCLVSGEHFLEVWCPQ